MNNKFIIDDNLYIIIYVVFKKIIGFFVIYIVTDLSIQNQIIGFTEIAKKCFLKQVEAGFSSYFLAFAMKKMLLLAF